MRVDTLLGIDLFIELFVVKMAFQHLMLVGEEEEELNLKSS